MFPLCRVGLRRARGFSKHADRRDARSLLVALLLAIVTLSRTRISDKPRANALGQ